MRFEPERVSGPKRLHASELRVGEFTVVTIPYAAEDRLASYAMSAEANV